MQIILSAAELGQCKKAAARRTNYARSSNIKNQRFAKDQSDLSVDYIGMVGELAVAKALGLQMDFDKVGVDYGIDFIYGDLKVDVKTRSHPNTELIFKSHEAFKAQVAILAKFKREDCVDILGCISRKRFKKHSKPAVYGCLGVSLNHLQPIEKLISYTQEQL
mgnify:FL=1